MLILWGVKLDKNYIGKILILLLLNYNTKKYACITHKIKFYRLKEYFISDYDEIMNRINLNVYHSMIIMRIFDN